MNKNLNTYLYSNISFMHSKVKHFSSKKKQKKFKPSSGFRAPDQRRGRGGEQSWEHSIQKCSTASICPFTHWK